MRWGPTLPALDSQALGVGGWAGDLLPRAGQAPRCLKSVGLLGLVVQGGVSRGKSLQSRVPPADEECLPFLPISTCHIYLPLPRLLGFLILGINGFCWIIY